MLPTSRCLPPVQLIHARSGADVVRDLCLTGHNLALAIQLANARILLEAEAGEADKAALDMLRGIANKAQDTFNTHLLGCAECRGHLPAVLQAVRAL
jgi:hypothetical protein